MRALGRRACLFVIATLAGAAAVGAGASKSLPIEVAAPDTAHVAWASTARLADMARRHGLEVAPRLVTAATSPESIVVLPVHEFAQAVPALGILQLPFFFRDLRSLHRAVDTRLGIELRAAARERGWELLAIWDEGLELMSGNLPYNQASSFSGREFLLLRDDRIAEKQFRALDVWTRRTRPASLLQLQQECLVGSRSTTAQQIVREQLPSVHLDVTLSRHRYEGWVLAMRSEAWSRLQARDQSALTHALREIARWQRDQARKIEDDSLANLKRDGMTMHALAPESWRRYRDAQPAWESFLDQSLPAEHRQRLVALALAAAQTQDSPAEVPAATGPRTRAP